MRATLHVEAGNGTLELNTNHIQIDHDTIKKAKSAKGAETSKRYEPTASPLKVLELLCLGFFDVAKIQQMLLTNS